LIFTILSFCVLQTAADCPAAPANPEDRRSNTAQLRVATFNVEWLFEGNDKSPWNVSEADLHLREVAQVLAALDLDIIGLQEVKNCEVLVRLIEEMKLGGAVGYKHYLKQGTDTATGQNVALLTRIDPVSNLQRTEARYSYPVPGNTCGSTSSGTSGCSKHFWADFLINRVEYRFFNFHFLAYPTDPARCVQREAQASVIRQLIDTAINDNKEIIVFGDYNDYSDAVLDSANDIPTSRVMKILREGLVGATSKGRQTDNEEVKEAFPPLSPANPSTLFEVSASLAQNDRYTSAYEVTKVSQIDHLLISQGIANRYLSTEVAHIYPRSTVSDHWPFLLTFST